MQQTEKCLFNSVGCSVGSEIGKRVEVLRVCYTHRISENQH